MTRAGRTLTLAKPGQKWRHVPSGDERYVHDIVSWEVAAGGPRGHYEVDYGITHVARMVRVRESDGFIARDRRDSSDMVLDENGGPRYRQDWEHLAAALRAEGGKR